MDTRTQLGTEKGHRAILRRSVGWCAMSADTYSKTDRSAHPDFFAAEAAGLQWLRDGGATVVDVLDVDRTHIELERLIPTSPTGDAARRFGAELAGAHDAGARQFGCPPEGFTGQMFIGARPMSSVEHPSWGAFYIAERVLPFLRTAVDAGNISTSDAADVERACGPVADGVFDDADPPARIHGDLWTGNVVWTASGVVMIDPAAHGGHRETDLAMLPLFGAPLLDDIVDGYRSVHPLRDGWKQRVPLHQLHPLAVHAAGHGPSYGVALRRAADAVARLS
ncbi:fructosamine kinase family protein [Rhodococcus sp. BP-252]|nr:fructosamine kinase family protein [Rhodococcus sp. BP-320]MBY6416940.1 fructosamine kinase family protein [Rhodococcus sp. BP-321]MBY6422097.1 fructosamine kinase family protein [Rhodococcus sp. BP-324]MBY6426964.1 fructosamine kinase family protein [Rhodococcus sp. BP-323]MBY6432293.1 fructosamine kinase family protein [Rhodococcus sp. BP-322]MBY6440938.1 fructosamine kinase family protein [Rhodococcus sp. BP-319]MBY6446078.1 fructosamine kinase family protein [Rhodococcus sp. BP-318]MB